MSEPIFTESCTHTELDEFKLGQWVLIQDLRIHAYLNGCYGRVMGKINESGRYPVSVRNAINPADVELRPKLESYEEYTSVVAAKAERIQTYPANLLAIPRHDLVDVVRLHCAGEDDGFITQLSLPRLHSRLKNRPAQGTCPILELLGVPLVCCRIASSRELIELSEFENSWASLFMIDTSTGVVPIEWQQHVGPVLLFRADGRDLSVGDVSCLNDVVAGLHASFQMENPKHFVDIHPGLVQKAKMAALLSNPSVRFNI